MRERRCLEPILIEQPPPMSFTTRSSAIVRFNRTIHWADTAWIPGSAPGDGSGSELSDEAPLLPAHLMQGLKPDLWKGRLVVAGIGHQRTQDDVYLRPVG